MRIVKRLGENTELSTIERGSTLVQETEGNAHFVVETMRMAHEQVEAQEGHAPTEPGGVQEVRVLPTIQAVMAYWAH